MLRRSILELSHRRCPPRIPRQIAALDTSIIPSRRKFSTAPQKNDGPKATPSGGPSESGSGSSKVVLGSIIIGGAVLAAYQAGYLDQYLGKKHHVPPDKKEEKYTQPLGEQVVSYHNEELNRSSRGMELPEQKAETPGDAPHHETYSETEGQRQSKLEDKSDLKLEESTAPIVEESTTSVVEERTTPKVEKELPEESSISLASDKNIEKVEPKATAEPSKAIQVTPANEESSAAPEEDSAKSIPSQHLAMEGEAKVEQSKGTEEASSLLDTYHLTEKVDESYLASIDRKDKQLPKETEDFATEAEELKDSYLSKDGKLVLDFLQAIHVAEKRQAELDAHVFAEERRTLKEKYEKELRDLRARELMRAEEAAMMEKELKRERTKTAAALKSLQEKMEEKLEIELQEKEKEAEFKLKKFEELAKAELASAIANEKAVQIEKMAEANLHIKALCMAFYARSEEARKSHTVHKIALGAIALEDALSKGLPIKKEVDALHSYLEGIEKDSVLDLVLSSLPDETQYHGTDTLPQLNQKFNALKGQLRHFSLIPPGGGGILTHSLAQIASWLKVKEAGQSGEGVESVISRVEDYLSEGNLAEAAAALEEGVKGSQAEEVIGDWVRRVRNRAITEQALTVLQSYATCISVT